jgi:glycosyltransferase involved in cell wall biosynthesis
VVHNGVGEPFEPQSEKQVNEVRIKYGLEEPYFLFVGTQEPRKNLGTLIQAWETADLKEYKLFIAGAQSVGHVFNVTGYGHSIRHAKSMTYIYVPDEDLPALYSGATAFVFPSLYEGFG